MYSAGWAKGVQGKALPLEVGRRRRWQSREYFNSMQYEMQPQQLTTQEIAYFALILCYLLHSLDRHTFFCSIHICMNYYNAGFLLA